MHKYKLTGGARIGSRNATYPFATLIVNKDRLEIKISLFGNLVFNPSDVISVETYTSIPFLGQGIKITHRVPDYQQKIIFWTLKNPSYVLNKIAETGFLNNINSEISSSDQQLLKKEVGFPVKKQVLIGAIIIWNLLFAVDIIKYFLNGLDGFPISYGGLLAIGLLFGTSLLTLISSDFRKLILKDGVIFDDIKKFIFFLMFVSGSMLFNLGIMTNVFH